MSSRPVSSVISTRARGLRVAPDRSFKSKVLYTVPPVALPLKHLALVVVVALAVLVGGVLYPMWRAAVDRSLDARADPYHIAGDLYFVGTPATTSFLLLGPKG